MKLSPSRAAGALLALCGFAAGARAELLYGLTSANQIVTFDSAAPGTLLSTSAITGTGGNALSDLAVQPSTGTIYALDVANNLYTLAPTGAATLVGTAGIGPGTFYGMGFNFVANRIRVTTDTGGNYRLNQTSVTNGAVMTTNDPALAYAAGGAAPALSGNAYSFNGGTLTLYALDHQTNSLVASTTPATFNVFNTLGGLGLDFQGSVGFDISVAGVANAANRFGYASLTTNGTQFGLYPVHLSTGLATLTGNFAAGVSILDIAAASPVPEPGVHALLALAGAAGGLVILRRRHRLA